MGVGAGGCCCDGGGGNDSCNQLLKDSFCRDPGEVNEFCPHKFSGIGDEWEEVVGSWTINTAGTSSLNTGDENAIIKWANPPGGTVRPLGMIVRCDSLQAGDQNDLSIRDEFKLYIAFEDEDNTYCATFRLKNQIFTQVILSKIIGGVETILQAGHIYDQGTIDYNYENGIDPAFESPTGYNYGISLGQNAFARHGQTPINKFVLSVFTFINPPPSHNLNGYLTFDIGGNGNFISVEVDPEELTTNGIALGTGLLDGLPAINFDDVRVYSGICYPYEHCISHGYYSNIVSPNPSSAFNIPLSYGDANQSETGTWIDAVALGNPWGTFQAPSVDDTERILNIRPTLDGGYFNFGLMGFGAFNIQGSVDTAHSLRPNCDIYMKVGDIEAIIGTDAKFTLKVNGSIVEQINIADGRFPYHDAGVGGGVVSCDWVDDDVWVTGSWSILICNSSSGLTCYFSVICNGDFAPNQFCSAFCIVAEPADVDGTTAWLTYGIRNWNGLFYQELYDIEGEPQALPTEVDPEAIVMFNFHRLISADYGSGACNRCTSDCANVNPRVAKLVNCCDGEVIWTRRILSVGDFIKASDGECYRVVHTQDIGEGDGTNEVVLTDIEIVEYIDSCANCVPANGCCDPKIDYIDFDLGNINEPVLGAVGICNCTVPGATILRAIADDRSTECGYDSFVFGSGSKQISDSNLTCAVKYVICFWRLVNSVDDTCVIEVTFWQLDVNFVTGGKATYRSENIVTGESECSGSKGFNLLTNPNDSVFCKWPIAIFGSITLH